MGSHTNIALIGFSLLITGFAQAEMTAREIVQKMNDN